MPWVTLGWKHQAGTLADLSLLPSSPASLSEALCLHLPRGPVCPVLHLPPPSSYDSLPVCPVFLPSSPQLTCALRTHTIYTLSPYTSSPYFHPFIYSANAHPWLLYWDKHGCGALAVSNQVPPFPTLSNECALGKVPRAGLPLKVTAGGVVALCVPLGKSMYAGPVL